MLQQEDEHGRHPIAYFSRKLKGAEVNWTTSEKETLTQILAIKEWRCHLEGAAFTMETDHHPLIYLQSQVNLFKKQARWMEYLQQFDFTITYVKGSDNKVADALSRRPAIQAEDDMDTASHSQGNLQMNAAIAAMVQPSEQWTEELRTALQTNQRAQQIRAGEVLEGWTQEAGLLYYGD